MVLPPKAVSWQAAVFPADLRQTMSFGCKHCEKFLVVRKNRFWDALGSHASVLFSQIYYGFWEITNLRKHQYIMLSRSGAQAGMLQRGKNGFIGCPRSNHSAKNFSSNAECCINVFSLEEMLCNVEQSTLTLHVYCHLYVQAMLCIHVTNSE